MMFKRGHTIKFKKPFIERINDRQLLIIEQEEKGYIRNVFENEIQITLPNKNMAMSLFNNEIKEYLQLTRI